MIDGHVEEVLRVSDQALSWLRVVANWVEQEKSLGTDLSTREIVELCERRGVDLPGSSGRILEDWQLDPLAGKALSKAFGIKDEISIGHHRIWRIFKQDPKNRQPKPFYRFENLSPG